MGLGDKVSDEVKQKVGQAKERIGDALDNDELEREGERDQQVAAVRKAGHATTEKIEQVTDAAQDKLDDAKDAVDEFRREHD